MGTFFDGIQAGTDMLLKEFGLLAVSWRDAILIVISLMLLFLGLTGKCKPILILPFAFGMLLTNLSDTAASACQVCSYWTEILLLLSLTGIGAKTDLSWLIAKPGLLFFGISAQIGLLFILTAAISSESLILNENTRTYIAYTYIALMPVLQPYLRRMTEKTAAHISTPTLPDVTHTEKVICPLLIPVLTGLLVPAAVPFMGFFMLGNLIRESRFCTHLVQTVSQSLFHTAMLLLGLMIGLSARSERILNENFLRLMLIGVLALLLSILCSILLGKLLYILTDGRLNPLAHTAEICTAGLLGIFLAGGMFLTVL